MAADTRDERLNDERLMDDLRQHDQRIYEQGVRDGRTGHDARYVEDVRDERVIDDRPVVIQRRGHGGLIAFILILVVALAIAAAYVFMPMTATTTSSTTTKQTVLTPVAPPPSAVRPADPAVTPPDASQGVAVTPDPSTGTTSAQAPTSQTVE